MTISAELSKHWQGRFVGLILDNEVTLGSFVANPAVPLIRLVNSQSGYCVADGYPCSLDAAQAGREMKNWDQVYPDGILSVLQRPGEGVDCFVIGNNAGQGLPLAAALDDARRSSQAVIIYGTSLPERERYQALGYPEFCARGEVLGDLLARAHRAGRELCLAFINTIQHNESNYHDP